MSEIVSSLLRNQIIQSLEDGRRLDGRALDEVRPLTIERGTVETAEGSARVHLGKTDVLVGIKATTGTPYPDTPNKGVMTTIAELIPMASPTFETGPPRPPAIELARVVDRGIRETKTIDVEKLCITPGEKVWIVFIDMHVLDYDGNLFDACSYGAMAALKNTMLPGSAIDQEEDIPLPVSHIPVSVTSAKIGDKIVVDPGLDEERITDARLTVVTDENGDIRAMQKGLNGSFSYDEIQRAIAVSRTAGQKLREIIAP